MRPRATIASQLYNAKEPMTLFELQAWLGHSTLAMTQRYSHVLGPMLTDAADRLEALWMHAAAPSARSS